MRTCRPVRTPLLRACQPAVPNPLIFTLLKPLFFSPIQLLSHTHCSHPSSCCLTPTVLLTHPAVVPHPLFFSPIKLLSHTHCSSHTSSCCPTPTVLLTHQAAVPHLRIFSLTGCCPTHIVHTHQPTVPLQLLNYSLPCPSSLCITLSLPLITPNYSLPAPHHSE